MISSIFPIDHGDVVDDDEDDSDGKKRSLMPREFATQLFHHPKSNNSHRSATMAAQHHTGRKKIAIQTITNNQPVRR